MAFNFSLDDLMASVNRTGNNIRSSPEEERRPRPPAIRIPEGVWAGGTDFISLDPDRIQYNNFDSSAPRWRILCLGLNYQSICESSGCPAYKQYVWIQCGMGKFDILDDIFKRVCCPECKKPAADPKNIGFWNCEFTIDGKQLAPERKLVNYTAFAPKDKYISFKGSEANWASLTITTKPNT